MNESMRLETVLTGQTYVITHLSNLDELFPGNKLLSEVLVIFQDFVFVEFSIFYGFTLINIGHYLVIC